MGGSLVEGSVGLPLCRGAGVCWGSWLQKQGPALPRQHPAWRRVQPCPRDPAVLWALLPATALERALRWSPGVLGSNLRSMLIL